MLKRNAKIMIVLFLVSFALAFLCAGNKHKDDKREERNYCHGTCEDKQ